MTIEFIGFAATQEFSETTGVGAGPAVDGMGLINIVGSYDTQFVLSFTACREMMPDPAHYADCIERSFGDLLAAT